MFIQHGQLNSKCQVAKKVKPKHPVRIKTNFDYALINWINQGHTGHLEPQS